MTVGLRHLTVKDCSERWASWLNNKETTRYLEARGHWTVNRLREWFRAQEAAGAQVYGIMANDTMVGTLKLHPVLAEAWTDLGLMIGVRVQRRCGIGTEAIRQAVELGRQAGAIGVWAGMQEGNVGSFWAFQRAGFAVVGWRGKDLVEATDIPGVIHETLCRWPPAPPKRLAVMRRLQTLVPVEEP